MKNFKVVITSISIALVVCMLLGVVYASHLLMNYPLEDIIHARFDTDKEEIEDIIDPSYRPSFTIPPKETIKSDEIINILLLGSDALTKNERGRSDSIMIATIDMKHGKLKLTSLLRDSYLELPGTDSKGKAYGWRKLNSAYYFGDATFVMETIEHNYGVKIDQYVVINFVLFQKVIDTIGGIELTISAEEAAYLMGRSEAEAGKNRKKMKEGTNQMDGKLALEFARARSAGNFTYVDASGQTVKVNNDYARTARQRYVLETIFKKMKDEDIGTLTKTATACFQDIRTNIPLETMLDYMSKALSIGVSQIHQQQIPYQGAFEPWSAPKPSVLYMDEENLQKNIDRIRQFIFEE